MQKHAGHLHEAQTTLRALLRDEPHNATASAQLAGYCVLAGDVNEGERWFKHFLDVNDGDADAQRNAAFYWATRNDLARTVASLHNALTLDPAVTRAYLADELEFERFRDEAAFQAL